MNQHHFLSRFIIYRRSVVRISEYGIPESYVFVAIMTEDPFSIRTNRRELQHIQQKEIIASFTRVVLVARIIQNVGDVDQSGQGQDDAHGTEGGEVHSHSGAPVGEGRLGGGEYSVEFGGLRVAFAVARGGAYEIGSFGGVRFGEVFQVVLYEVMVRDFDLLVCCCFSNKLFKSD